MKRYEHVVLLVVRFWNLITSDHLHVLHLDSSLHDLQLAHIAGLEKVLLQHKNKIQP